MGPSLRATGARAPCALLLILTLAACGDDEETSTGASCLALAACEADAGDPGAAGGSDGGASPGLARDAAPADGAGHAGAGGGVSARAESRLVAPDALGDLLAGDGVVLIDARGAGDYASGHLVGALSVDVSGALRATVDGVPGQLPPLEQVADVLSQAGVPADGSAVVYGASSDLNAARLVWTLEYLGHPDVRLLDGGYAAQPALGAEIETGADDAPRSDFPLDGVDADRRVDAT
ncbi:MAG: rhodanese-like domain-containing protein, partial [Myxococcales bacterium]